MSRGEKKVALKPVPSILQPSCFPITTIGFRLGAEDKKKHSQMPSGHWEKGHPFLVG